MPTIRLVTWDDVRSITSQNAHLYLELPTLYIPAHAADIAPDPSAATDHPELMRSWAPAKAEGDASVTVFERLYPGSVVAPRDVGQYVLRGDLLYHGAELAADFL